MIKNIVFDLGGVLISFDPSVLIRHLGFDDEKALLYKKLFFCGEEWRKFDASEYNFNELVNNLIKNYSQYSDDIKYIFSNIDYKYILFEKKDTIKYLVSLKQRGYNIYILSDLAEDSYNFNSKLDFFKYVDGGVYSFKVGSTKPNENNYRVLLDTYGLVPEETIFIDDLEKNVEGAMRQGIHGIRYTGLEQLIQDVEKITGNTY